MAAHERKVQRALALAVDAVAGEPAALAELTRQAELHDRAHLDVPPAMYGLWLEALIGAVRTCDPEFDLVVEHSWRLLMAHVIRHMVRHY